MPPYAKRASTTPSWSVYDGETEIVGRIPTEYQADVTIRKLEEAYAKGAEDAGQSVEPSPDVPPPPVEPEPSPTPTPGIRVTSVAQIQSALANAKGGERIVVANGSYSGFVYKKKFPSRVTLVAENRRQAKFTSQLRFDDSANLTVEGFVIATFYTIRSSGMWLVDNDIFGGHNVVIFNDCPGLKCNSNYIHEGRSDLLRVTGDSSGEIINNYIYDAIPQTGDHPDLIQMLKNYTTNMSPHDIVISGNYLFDSKGTGTLYGQGIFLKDATYRRILIEQNLLGIGTPNTIYVADGVEGVVIRNNSLRSWTDPASGGGALRLVGNCGGVEAYGNALLKTINETSVPPKKLTGNITAPDDFYQGPPSTWQGFLPKPGSPIDFGSPYGAQQRLKELQAA
jgi:hypothetical protein